MSSKLRPEAKAWGSMNDIRWMPNEVLAVVFSFCDARTLLMVVPAVSKRWLGACQHLMRHAIDLDWATRVNRSITDTGLAGVVLRFPSVAAISLKGCGRVTDGGLEAVAAGCPNLQHLNLA